jgi:hypothetical protein
MMSEQAQRLRQRLQDFVAQRLRDGVDMDLIFAALAEEMPPEAAEDMRVYLTRIAHRMDYARLFSQPSENLLKLHASRWAPLMGEIRVAAEVIVENNPPGTFSHLEIALAELDQLERVAVEQFGPSEEGA